ncbi:hypothetical protein ACS0TY_017752 [Phlomoides rotata]
MVSAIIFLRKKKKQILMEDPDQIEAVDELAAPESVQYSFICKHLIQGIFGPRYVNT